MVKLPPVLYTLTCCEASTSSVLVDVDSTSLFCLVSSFLCGHCPHIHRHCMQLTSTELPPAVFSWMLIPLNSLALCPALCVDNFIWLGRPEQHTLLNCSSRVVCPNVVDYAVIQIMCIRIVTQHGRKRFTKTTFLELW